MPVLERSALADSPLADLHAIASELGIDGFRRLRKEDLIDAIVARQSGDGEGGDDGRERADEHESEHRDTADGAGEPGAHPRAVRATRHVVGRGGPCRRFARCRDSNEQRAADRGHSGQALDSPP